MQINNNSQTNFGMAYKMTNVPVASRKIAESISNLKDPEAKEKFFIEELVKPIKGLKTIVSTDGDKVIIEHPVSKAKFEVLDTPVWSDPSSQDRVMNYVVQDLQVNGTEGMKNIEVRYSEPQGRFGSNIWASGVGLFDGIIRKHINALEIAKKFDDDLAKEVAKSKANIAKKENIAAMSSRLAELSD